MTLGMTFGIITSVYGIMALPCGRCVLSGTERQEKGEYLMRKRHGLRRIFSLLLATIMVCALLPTAAFAADTTETNLVVGNPPPPRTKTSRSQSRKKHLPLSPSGAISGMKCRRSVCT